jgi:hypothetical protein
MAYSSPASCAPSSILANGSFELGTTGWTESSLGGFPIIGNNGSAHDGVMSAWLGGYQNADDVVYQTINIPAGRTALQADFYIHITSQDVSATAHDKFYVSLQPAGSVTLPEVWYFDNRYASTGWWHATVTYNELPYAGQALRLYFHATTDLSFNTNFFLDQVSVHVQCTRYAALTNANGAPSVTIERVADRPAPARSILPRTK